MQVLFVSVAFMHAYGVVVNQAWLINNWKCLYYFPIRVCVCVCSEFLCTFLTSLLYDMYDADRAN